MAYKFLTNKACANRAAVLSEIWTALSAMGWTLHDNMDASSYRVYSSNGESSDRITEYIKITWTTANKITFQVYGWWNNTTHAGTCANTATADLTTAETGCYVWIYGDKNTVYICTKVSTTYYAVMFGHVKTRLHTLVTSLTAGAGSGNDVTITVVSTTGFVPGKGYQIFSPVGEGRDWVTVASITDATQMVISNLPRAYSSGSFIGICPSTFGLFNSTNFYQTCPRLAVGTTNYSASGMITTDLFNLAGTNPDARIDARHLTPIRVAGSDTTSSTNSVGYHDGNILYCPTTGINNEDTLGVGQLDPLDPTLTNTAESGTANTLTDTDKSWSTDQWAGKVVIITLGTGVGQIRKIASNTSDTLTVTENWVTIPDATSQYVICEEGYRFIGGTVHTITYALREGV